MMREEKLKVGISIGDLNGIGGEIIIKTFEDTRMLDFCIFHKSLLPAGWRI